MKDATRKTSKNTSNQKQTSTREARQARNAKRRQQILFRRRLMLLIAAVVVVVIVVLVAKNSLSSKADVSTIVLNEDGTVTCEEVVEFDKSEYDKAGLKTYVKKTVDDYNSANSTAITVEKVKVSGDEAYTKIVYPTVAEYADFTKYAMYTGSMNAALNDGYTFMDSFVSVKDGQKADSVETIDVTSNKECNVLIIKENINVKVPGKILYVSDKNTTIVDDSTVAIAQTDGNNDATQLTYIVYEVEK